MVNKLDKIKEQLEGLKKKRDDLSYDMYGGPDEYEDDNSEYDNPEHRLGWINSQIRGLEAEERDLERREKQRIQINSNNNRYQEAKEKFKRGSIKVDDETAEDRIGRSIYANVIAKYIINKKTAVPFNIGIFGGWGEGKSSFLELIAKEIRINNNLNSELDYRTHIVKYDATEYSEKDKIWACILRKLFEKFEEDKGLKGRMKFFWSRFTENFKSKIWKYVINFLVFITTILFGIKISGTIEASKIKETLIYVSLSIVPLIITIMNIIIPAIKGQLKLAIPIAEVISKNIEFPNYDKQLGKKENLRKDLKYLENAWFNKNERIVIFIDEIDRCSEKAISELLESLQLFLKSKNIVILMSVDIIAISKVLYTDRKDKIKCTVEYLEKYITLPIYLQEINDYNLYIDYLMDKEQSIQLDKYYKNESSPNIIQNMTINDNKYCFTGIEEQLIKNIIHEINIRNHITPRKVKRIFNMLNLSKQICIALSDIRGHEEKILFDNYIKWFLFAYFNSDVAFILEERTKYDKFASYATVNEMYSALNIGSNNNIMQEKTIEEIIKVDNKHNKKINRIIKEIIKENKQINEFSWLKKYVEEITKSQLNTIKEVSRMFIISEKRI